MTSSEGADPQIVVWRGRVRQCLADHSRNREVVRVAKRLRLASNSTRTQNTFFRRRSATKEKRLFRDTLMVRLLDYGGHIDVRHFVVPQVAPEVPTKLYLNELQEHR